MTLGFVAGAVGMAQPSRPIDDAALKDAGRIGDEWISYNVNWSEQRYSPLNQINASNVSRLGLAWYTDIPAAPGRPQTHQEGTPLVHDGVLYSIAPWSVTLKNLKAGAYEFRVRTIDLNGFAQPEPRPYPKSGRNEIQYRAIMVMG